MSIDFEMLSLDLKPTGATDASGPANGSAGTAAAARAAGTPGSLSANDSSAISFDFDLDLGEPKAAGPGLASARPTSAMQQDMAMKLDLASAYQEIGDAEGARELLNEVIASGDAELAQKAQALLSRLG